MICLYVKTAVCENSQHEENRDRMKGVCRLTIRTSSFHDLASYAIDDLWILTTADLHGFGDVPSVDWLKEGFPAAEYREEWKVFRQRSESLEALRGGQFRNEVPSIATFRVPTAKKESPGPNMSDGRMIVLLGLASKNDRSASAFVR
jgi:hypothetical protein